MNIVVAGASGYIGIALVPYLQRKFPEAHIYLLSRAVGGVSTPHKIWRKCDLFSLKSLEEALPDTIDVAYYLVHSMGPTAHLDQGSFADYDLILADNFSRAVKKKNVRQLIYLGGLLPDSQKLSLHLRSRWEVEETFRSYGLPLTVFRAGIIIGEEGSSTQILLKLVARLPVMICPSWTQTLTSPVDLNTVLKALSEAAGDSGHLGKVYDLAGCRPLTYVEMMRETAAHTGKSRRLFTVPVFTPWLSRLWVSVVTNSPRALVYPLIQSLAHPMVARPERAFPSANSARSYSEMIAGLSLHAKPQTSVFRFRPVGQSVRSVQRLPLPKGRNAEWVRHQYMEWLPKCFRPWLRVATEGPQIQFFLGFLSKLLLKLEVSESRSSADRQLLYLKGGLLQRAEGGRLEFREAMNGSCIIAAIHDYRPSLPWPIYKHTQARIHLYIMRKFGRWLDH